MARTTKGAVPRDGCDAQTTETNHEKIVSDASAAVDSVAQLAHTLGVKAAQSKSARWARLAVDAMQLVAAVHLIGEAAVLELEQEGATA